MHMPIESKAPRGGERFNFVDPALLRACVHCGLCLPACPTYRELGIEQDSPRGRIYGMVALAKGELTTEDPRLRLHLGRCLDCRACETACPSGVQYGRLIEAARAVIRPESRRERLTRKVVLDGVFRSNRLLDLLGLGMRLYQNTGAQHAVRKLGLLRPFGKLGSLESLLPRFQGRTLGEKLPRVTPAVGPCRGRAAFIEGCVQKQFFGLTNRQTVELLAANGLEVVVPEGQGCCGALHLHSGERESARALARRNIEAFEQSGADYYVINAAGCGSTLKEYGELLAEDSVWAERAHAFASRMRDATELLHEIGLTMPLGPLHGKVTYHDACHLAHGQGVRDAPRSLLAAIPEIELVPLPDSDTCCGSAGIYNLTHPELANDILQWKVDAIESTGAEIVLAANPGCIIQIAAGLKTRRLKTKVLHPIDLLYQSYRAAR